MGVAGESLDGRSPARVGTGLHYASIRDSVAEERTGVNTNHSGRTNFARFPTSAVRSGVERGAPRGEPTRFDLRGRERPPHKRRPTGERRSEALGYNAAANRAATRVLFRSSAMLAVRLAPPVFVRIRSSRNGVTARPRTPPASTAASASASARS